MSNEELLLLLREDRPDQVIHEVTDFRVHPLSKYGVEYEVDVVMETHIFETKIRRHHIKGLPYPIKPYKDLQEKWATEPLEKSLNELNQNKDEYGI